MIDLDKLESLHQSTTPGPWTHVKDGPMFMGTADWVEGSTVEIRGRAYREWPNNYEPLVEADIAWIVAAHEAFPALLQELKDLRELRDYIRDLERNIDL